jgi:hypothetical protein
MKTKNILLTAALVLLPIPAKGILKKLAKLRSSETDRKEA